MRVSSFLSDPMDNGQQVLVNPQPSQLLPPRTRQLQMLGPH